MSFNRSSIIASFVLVILVSVVATVIGWSSLQDAQRNQNHDESNRTQTTSQVTNQVQEKLVTTGESNTTVEGVPAESKSESGANSGVYRAYSPELLKNAENGKVVLFFKAEWCTTCKALESSIQQNLGDWPAEVTILYTEWEFGNSELDKRYQVPIQHTLIQVDSNGEVLNRWVGGNSMESIIQNLV